MRTHMNCVALLLAACMVGCGHDEHSRLAQDISTTSMADSAAESGADSRLSHDVHDGHAVAAPEPLPPGKLWATDESLRTGMQRIRTAVEISANNQNHQLTSSGAQALTATVKENISFMVANCRLEAKPDAALHALIVRMLNATTTLEKGAPFDTGVQQLRDVLRDYQSTFDHPGWTPLAAN